MSKFWFYVRGLEKYCEIFQIYRKRDILQMAKHRHSSKQWKIYIWLLNIVRQYNVVLISNIFLCDISIVRVDFLDLPSYLVISVDEIFKHRINLCTFYEEKISSQAILSIHCRRGMQEVPLDWELCPFHEYEY